MCIKSFEQCLNGHAKLLPSSLEELVTVCQGISPLAPDGRLARLEGAPGLPGPGLRMASHPVGPGG